MMLTLFAAVMLAIPQTDSALVFRNARVLDLRSGTAQQNITLVVQDGRIAARGARVAIPPRARIIDARELTLLAGLIDSHVHLTLAGRPRDNAAITAKAGFTTVADLGSPAGAGVRLKRLIEADSVTGPTIIAGGSWIGGKGGVCEFGGATIRGAAEAEARASADMEAGAELLKLCVTNWLVASANAPDSVELTADEMTAVAQRAAQKGLPIAAHALNQAGVLAALKVNAKLLAHTPIVDDATARSLANAGVCVATTMKTLTANDTFGALRRSFDLLRRNGVRLVLGTDAGVLPHGRNAEELIFLQELGMTPLQALQAATTEPARCWGIANYGSLQVGDVADIVAVRGDPLTDLRLLLQPVLVVRQGRVLN